MLNTRSNLCAKKANSHRAENHSSTTRRIYILHEEPRDLDRSESKLVQETEEEDVTGATAGMDRLAEGRELFLEQSQWKRGTWRSPARTFVRLGTSEW